MRPASPSVRESRTGTLPRTLRYRGFCVNSDGISGARTATQASSTPVREGAASGRQPRAVARQQKR